MAPERFLDDKAKIRVLGASKEGDIYSLAMTSFSVCTLFGKHTDT